MLSRVARARGVRQQGHAHRDVVQNAVGLGIRAAQRERDHLRARVLHGRVDQVKRILARAEDKAGGKFMPAEDECIVLHDVLSFFL